MYYQFGFTKIETKKLKRGANLKTHLVVKRLNDNSTLPANLKAKCRPYQKWPKNTKIKIKLR